MAGTALMSLNLFDAATGGNEIYSENIDTVILDDNGVYRFQFGAGGQSMVDGRTTIALPDGVVAATPFQSAGLTCSGRCIV